MSEQEPVTKKCPFLGALCEENECALYTEFGVTKMGMRKKVGMCVFVGSNIILSEMNMKIQQQGKPPMPQIQFPHSGRG